MEKIYYSISEVAEIVQEPQSKLRYWETQFSVLSPKRKNTTRYYVQADIDTIRSIKYLLQQQRMTIEGANQRLKTDRKRVERTQQVVDKLTALKKELSAIRLELNQTEALAEQVVIE